MNIIEKVLQLKQDFDNVYAAGKAAGGGNLGYKTTEVKITSNVTNAKALFDIIFKDADLAHNLVAYLTHPQETDCIYNQITFLSNTDGIKRGVRYRDGVHSTIEIATNYDAALTIGDIYTVVDLDEYVEDKDYEQGYEDGKNSVVIVPFDRNLRTATFTSLNMFGKKEVELNFDNLTSLSNLFYINAEKNKNTIVEKLTINCTKQITNIMNMFYCNGTNWFDQTLKHITFNFDTQKCTTFSNAFNGVYALEIVDGQPLNFSSVTNASYMPAFSNTPKLVECRFVANSIKLNFNISKSPNLSTDTIQSIIDGLADLSPRYYEVQQTGENTFENTGRLIENVISERVYTVDDNGLTIYYVDYGTEPPDIFSCMAYKEGGGTAQTLTLHSTVGNKLTDTQKTTITAKNWTLVY